MGCLLGELARWIVQRECLLFYCCFCSRSLFNVVHQWNRIRHRHRRPPGLLCPNLTTHCSYLRRQHAQNSLSFSGPARQVVFLKIIYSPVCGDTIGKLRKNKVALLCKLYNDLALVYWLLSISVPKSGSKQS